jgi:hypothetical protein
MQYRPRLDDDEKALGKIGGAEEKAVRRKRSPFPFSAPEETEGPTKKAAQFILAPHFLNCSRCNWISTTAFAEGMFA